MIEFNCPKCDKLLRTKPEKAGAKAKCPGCGEVLVVPGGEATPVRKTRKPAEDEWGGSREDDYGFGDDDYNSPAQDDEWGVGQTRLPPRQKKSSRSGSGSPRAGRKQECPMCGEMTSTTSSRCEHCGESLKKSSSSRRSRRRGYDEDYAGFWLRFVAYIVDSILLGIVNFIIGFVVGLMFGAAGGMQQNPQGPPDGAFLAMQMGLNIVSIVIAWLYYSFMESSEAQATFGKQMLGIIVTDMDGERISFGKATGRFFGKIISGIICAAGYIMAGFTEQKQALHDIMAGCLVVRR